MSGVGSPPGARWKRSCGSFGERAFLTLSRELGTTAATLSQWRGEFLRGGQGALRARPADEGNEEIPRLKAKVGELTMANELLEEKIDRLEADRPLAQRRWRR